MKGENLLLLLICILVIGSFNHVNHGVEAPLACELELRYRWLHVVSRGDALQVGQILENGRHLLTKRLNRLNTYMLGKKEVV